MIGNKKNSEVFPYNVRKLLMASLVYHVTSPMQASFLAAVQVTSSFSFRTCARSVLRWPLRLQNEICSQSHFRLVRAVRSAMKLACSCRKATPVLLCYPGNIISCFVCVACRWSLSVAEKHGNDDEGACAACLQTRAAGLAAWSFDRAEAQETTQTRIQVRSALFFFQPVYLFPQRERSLWINSSHSFPSRQS